MSRMTRLFTVVVLLSAGYSLAMDWNFDVVQPASVGWWTSLELDNSGYPHMSYRMENGQDLSYVCWDGSAWQTTIVDTEESVGWCTSLALDSSDYPHISYRDNSNFNLK